MLRSDDFGSTTYWGGVAAGLCGLLLAGLTIREIRRARNTVRGTTATGRIVSTSASKTNYYGDTVAKAIDVVFTTANGTRIKFTEEVGESFADRPEVTVHYDPQHPRDTATVLTSRTAFIRVAGYATASLVGIGLFVTSQISGGKW